MPLFSKLRQLKTRKGLLEEAVPVPPRDSPGHFMYHKHGLDAILYLDLWADYTKDLEEKYRWPVSGTWDAECIMRVEEALWKKKARQSQKDAIELWRKESHKRTEKEFRKTELSRESSEKAQERELIEEGERVRAEQSDRQRNALIKGMYPLLAEGLPKATPEAPCNLPPPLVPTKLRHKPTAADIFLSSYLDDTVPAYANPIPPAPVNNVIPVPPTTGPVGPVNVTAPPAQPTLHVPVLPVTLPARTVFTDDSSLGAAGGGSPRTPPQPRRLTLHDLALQRTPKVSTYVDITRLLTDCRYDPVPGEDHMVIYSLRLRRVASYLVTLPDMEEHLDRIYRFIRTGENPGSIHEAMVQRKVETQLMILKFLINCLIREQDCPDKDQEEMKVLTRWSDNIADGKHKTQGCIESMYKKIHPAGFHRELKDMLRMGEYTYPDIIKMLKVLLPAGIYEKLKEKEWEVGEKKIDWTALETEDNTRVPGTGLGDKAKALPELLIQVLPRLLATKKEDWDAISACKQKQDEDTSDFYSRFDKCFIINSGLKTSSESYPHLFVTKLVENSSPQVKNRVLKVESTWQANTPSQMLQMLQYHQNRIREEQEHERRRMKDTKMKVLVAQSVPQDSQKRGPNQASHPAAPVKGTCNYCKQPGHYINECAVLKHNIATGKTKERPRPPRQEQASQNSQPPQNAQQTVTAPQPIAATQHVTQQMYQYAQSEYPDYQPYS
ncbi:uncharacterized protein LOC144769359 [Lissotriton helveticus]